MKHQQTHHIPYRDFDVNVNVNVNVSVDSSVSSAIRIAAHATTSVIAANFASFCFKRVVKSII